MKVNIPRNIPAQGNSQSKPSVVISPNIKRTREQLDRNGNIIRKIEQ